MCSSSPDSRGEDGSRALAHFVARRLGGMARIDGSDLCPLKALLNKLTPRVQKYASFAGLRASVWHGDIGEAARRGILSDPPEILLTTPKSLQAVLISVRTDHKKLLGSVRAVVVDELHAFAGDDRGWHVLFLLARLERLTGRGIQRVGLSATVGNPNELLDWLSTGRGGQVIGRAQAPSEGEVTVDYVGSIANAVVILSRLFRGSVDSFFGKPIASQGDRGGASRRRR